MSNNVFYISGKPLKTGITREDWIESILSMCREKAPSLPLEYLLEAGRELAWAQAIRCASADCIELWEPTEQEWLVDVTSINDPDVRAAVAHYAAIVCRIDVFLEDFRQLLERQKGAKP